MGRDFLSDMPHNDRKTFLRKLTIYRVKNKDATRLGLSDEGRKGMGKNLEKAASIQYSERVKL